VTERLATLAGDLVELLRRQPEHRLRSLSLRMAEVAEAHVGLGDPRLEEAIAALRAGRIGNGVMRTRLQQLTDELDEVAWDLQDRVKSGSAANEEYMKAFARARAVSAAWFALDPDPVKAAVEATYEAQAAINDLALIRREISSVISS